MSLDTSNEEKVKKRFGEKNYNRIIEDCETASIDLNNLLEIAKHIDNRVYGQLKRNQNVESFTLLCRHMLSYWWKIDGGNGVQLQRFIEILKTPNINQNALATELDQDMKPMAVPISVVTTNPDTDDPQIQDSQGNETEMVVQNALKKLKKSLKTPVSKKNRKALLIGNTYKKEPKDHLLGCEDSAKSMEIALDTNLGNKGKVKFDCYLQTNLSVEQIKESVKEICKQANDESADVVLVYISGHGDHEPLEIKNEDEVDTVVPDEKEKLDGIQYLLNTTVASVSEGGNFIWGEKLGKIKGKLYKNQLIAQICKETENVGHRIIIFDCCRGDLIDEKRSMNASGKKIATLNVEFSNLKDLSNKDYKNTFVFHSTLPHQVAWCGSQTTFSKYFCDFVGGQGGLVDINCLDVTINAAIKTDEPSGTGKGNHVQMVELTKWVDQPFSW